VLYGHTPASRPPLPDALTWVRFIAATLEGKSMKNGKLLSLLAGQPHKADIVVKIGELELDVVSVVRAEPAGASGNAIVLRINSVDLHDLVREIRAMPK
jgi:hypothetical protein